MEDKITGQIIARDMGEYRDGRRLVMVFGVIAVPDGVLASEHQYTVYGSHHEHGATVTILADTKQDVSDVSLGSTPSGLLCSGMWRV